MNTYILLSIDFFFNCILHFRDAHSTYNYACISTVSHGNLDSPLQFKNTNILLHQ